MGGTTTGMVTVEDVPSKAYRGVEILLLLPIALYRRSRPSASGLDPEGEGRKPR